MQFLAVTEQLASVTLKAGQLAGTCSYIKGAEAGVLILDRQALVVQGCLKIFFAKRDGAGENEGQEMQMEEAESREVDVMETIDEKGEENAKDDRNEDEDEDEGEEEIDWELMLRCDLEDCKSCNDMLGPREESQGEGESGEVEEQNESIEAEGEEEEDRPDDEFLARCGIPPGSTWEEVFAK